MLKRFSAGTIALIVLVLFVPTTARADVSCERKNWQTGACTITVTDPGGPEGPGDPGAPGRDQGPATCTGADGAAIPCSGPEGSLWYAPKGCYAVDVTGDYMPPAEHESFWASVIQPDTDLKDYVALKCVNDGIAFPVIQAGGLRTLQQAIDPAVVAQQALQQMNLHAGQIGTTPGSANAGKIGVIGLPTWMWITDPGPETTGPQTKTVTAGGTTVTVTASVASISWDMGDGNTITCAGPGTPYDDSYGAQDSPTCGYRYQKQGTYTVTATTVWAIAWTGAGQSGTIPLTVTNATTITMGEVQVVVTKPGK